jgi:cytochrome c-type biogenesis protein CcmH/NrfG
MKIQDQPHDRRVVTSDAIQRHRSSPQLWLISAIAAVVLFGTGGFYYYVMSRDHTQPASQSKELTQTPTQELRVAQVDLGNAKTSSQKSTAQVELGKAYFDNNQAPAAITAFKTSISENGSNQENVLPLLASAYYRNGQISEEIVTIQQLIPLLQQSSDSATKALVPRYQNLILTLQGLQG